MSLEPNGESTSMFIFKNRIHKGRRKKHLTFSDTVFGPNPAPLMELLAERARSRPLSVSPIRLRLKTLFI